MLLSFLVLPEKFSDSGYSVDSVLNCRFVKWIGIFESSHLGSSLHLVLLVTRQAARSQVWIYWGQDTGAYTLMRLGFIVLVVNIADNVWRTHGVIVEDGIGITDGVVWTKLSLFLLTAETYPKREFRSLEGSLSLALNYERWSILTKVSLCHLLFELDLLGIVCKK